MRAAKLFGFMLIAGLAASTAAQAQQAQALLLPAPAPRIQNFTPVQSVFACHWDCYGIKTEIACPSGTHCSCTCPGGPGVPPICGCVVPP
jgi:hypothetical protein